MPVVPSGTLWYLQVLLRRCWATFWFLLIPATATAAVFVVPLGTVCYLVLLLRLVLVVNSGTLWLFVLLLWRCLWYLLVPCGTW